MIRIIYATLGQRKCPKRFYISSYAHLYRVKMRLCAHLFLNLRAGSGLVSGAGIYSIESGQKWASQSLEVNKDEVLRLVEAFTDPTPIFEKGMTPANASSFSIYTTHFEFNIRIRLAA